MLIDSGSIKRLFFSSQKRSEDDEILEALQNGEVQIPHDSAGMMG
jgi:hypothetical protein